MSRPKQILSYWFGNLDSGEGRFDLWFGKSEETDLEIRERFEADLEIAAKGELDSWQKEQHSCLALILLLDQFPRNIYRDDKKAFAFDEKARRVCLQGLERNLDAGLPVLGRLFFYLPLEHSEDLELQERSVKLFEGLLEDAPDEMNETFKLVLDYAYRHRDIIKRFGRFPHRNQALGRRSTPEETEFLKKPGSSF